MSVEHPYTPHRAVATDDLVDAFDRLKIQASELEKKLGEARTQEAAAHESARLANHKYIASEARTSNLLNLAHRALDEIQRLTEVKTAAPQGSPVASSAEKLIERLEQKLLLANEMLVNLGGEPVPFTPQSRLGKTRERSESPIATHISGKKGKGRAIIESDEEVDDAGFYLDHEDTFYDPFTTGNSSHDKDKTLVQEDTDEEVEVVSGGGEAIVKKESKDRLMDELKACATSSPIFVGSTKRTAKGSQPSIISSIDDEEDFFNDISREAKGSLALKGLATPRKKAKRVDVISIDSDDDKPLLSLKFPAKSSAGQKQSGNKLAKVTNGASTSKVAPVFEMAKKAAKEMESSTSRAMLESMTESIRGSVARIGAIGTDKKKVETKKANDKAKDTKGKKK